MSKNKKRLLAGLAAAALILTACSRSEQAEEQTDIVRLGIVGSIYEELWAPAQQKLRAEGIDLQLVTFSDYVMPNKALAEGEIDLNAFQHRIYLQGEQESHGYAIQNIGNTFVNPLNLYSKKISSVGEMHDGDIVAIPNDATNGGRALNVLADAGLIVLREDAGFNPTLRDIEHYRVGIRIEELAANTIPAVLPDVTAAVITDNYALDFGLNAEDAIFFDTNLEQKEYWNLIAARTADLDDPARAAVYRSVVEAFQAPETAQLLENRYSGYFIKAGWEEELLRAPET